MYVFEHAAKDENQLSFACDRRIGPEGPPHTDSSYKLIPSNNNPCPHLLQHALPALAINQRIPSALSREAAGEDGEICGLDVVIVMLCN